MQLVVRQLFDPQQALLFDPRPEGEKPVENEPVPPAATESTTPRTANRHRHGPAAFLKDYRGYLQADAFNGYDGIYLESDPIVALAGGIPCVVGDGGAEGLAEERRSRRDGLHAEQLARVVPVHRIGLVGHRQQRGRKRGTRHRARTQELALLWKRPRWPRGGDPFQPVDVLQAS